MAREEQTNKTDAEFAERAWELAEHIGTAMLVTWDGSQQRMRPMRANLAKAEHAIYFLAAVSSGEVNEIDQYPAVSLGFVDTGSNKYVAISGQAMITNDREKIRTFWTPFAKAWWDSAEDPRIRLITFKPEKAEIWDSPGKLIAGVKMLSAAVTGAKPTVGDHARVAL